MSSSINNPTRKLPQIQLQDNPTEKFSNWCSLFPNDTFLCHVDKKLAELIFSTWHTNTLWNYNIPFVFHSQDFILISQYKRVYNISSPPADQNHRILIQNVKKCSNRDIKTLTISKSSLSSATQLLELSCKFSQQIAKL